MTYRLEIQAGPEIAHYPPGATFGPRTLHNFEFVWLLEGQARWLCDGRNEALHPGLLLLAQPGMRDEFRWDTSGPTKHGFVHFRLVRPGLLSPPGGWPLTRPLTSSDPLAALCRHLLWLAGTPSGVARACDVLGWLLDLFVRGPLPAGDPLPEHLARLADHLRSAAWRGGQTPPLSLAAMAAATGVSPGHLSRLFRAEYALGPVAAVEMIRLARAATLLQRSNLPVLAVASACGFANPYHFSRRFRGVYGMPPRSYRQGGQAYDPLEPLTQAGLLEFAHRILIHDLS